MSGHTPGPWEAFTPQRHEPGRHACIAQANSVGDIHIADVWLADGVEGRGEANARLLAAAPELLAFARECAASCGECNGTGTPEFGEYAGQPCIDCADVRALIAKATAP